MKLLLDTHIFVDWVAQIKLTPDEIQAINRLNLKRRIFISSIIFWEIALLAEKNKLERNIESFTEAELIAWKDELLEKSNVRMIDPTTEDQIKSVNLPKHHKDPFDRLLIAQTINNDMKILTRDKTIPSYEIETIHPRQIPQLANRIS